MIDNRTDSVEPESVVIVRENKIAVSEQEIRIALAAHDGFTARATRHAFAGAKSKRR
jgi:hypothetical protein